MPRTGRQAAAEDPARRRTRRRNALAAVIGSVLEWYDFFLFSTSAALVFNKIFFSGESEFAATLASFATFAVGFAARPVGGLILAHLGDRWGRKPVLLATVLLMGASTLAIGVLPTYDQIGIWAPALLVFCRIVQGLGVGAELAGAYVWTTESSTPERRGYYAALPGAGEFLGVVCASGAMAVVSSMDEESFLSWGWRIPYLASLIVVAAGVVLRYLSEESETFKNARAEGRTRRTPLVTAVRGHGKRILLMIGAGCATAVASYSIQGYLPSYTTQQLGLPPNVAVIAITVASAVSVLGVPLCGALSDRVGRRPLIIGGGVAIAAFAFPFWLVVGTGSLPLITLAVILGFAVLLNSLIFAPSGSFFSELLPTEVRYSGLVLARETTAVLFSGTAPFVATLLVHAAGGTPWLLGGYMALSGLITAGCVLLLPETAPRVLRRKGGGQGDEGHGASADTDVDRAKV
ncbi:MFS transporter [Streptomyces sp. ODS28]|uniref:MFS transporter n=1 Tax=Streptomyces sp. ODS28 TaxID=3136688 RepID=UPI0031EF5F14